MIETDPLMRLVDAMDRVQRRIIRAVKAERLARARRLCRLLGRGLRRLREAEAQSDLAPDDRAALAGAIRQTAYTFLHVLEGPPDQPPAGAESMP
jgi:hypothetical protein